MEKRKLSLNIINPHAAGIDIGSKFPVVAIDQDIEHVRSFGVFTKDHLN